ncbi:XamI family restriction endonuclease [Rhabdothermincola sp.]|uniref:XamI family restriction endonuclease n=1 Tax=Rhabdothermincola sp. TaxID=2820405 RepID=UPI002FE33705
MAIIPPPRWTDAELDASREGAIEIFRNKRMAEVLDPYIEAYEDSRQSIAELFELTVDLKQILDEAVELTTNPGTLHALRYMAGPPISEDDLKVLADVNTLNPTRLRQNPGWAHTLVEIVLMGLDPNRFPWVAEGRDPTDEERETAIVATAVMMAQRRQMTDRANESKDAQEKATAAALVNAGFHQVPPRQIDTFAQAPRPGEFCHESLFGGRKADLVVRLWDGRCMPIECKVSNSSTNSVKRLNNDAAVKAKVWLSQFGTAQTVPAAVLGGVYKLHNLCNAQAEGLTLFWAHELDRLVEFVTSTRTD